MDRSRRQDSSYDAWRLSLALKSCITGCPATEGALSSIPLLDESYREVLRLHGVRGDDARDRLDLHRHGVFRQIVDEDAAKKKDFAAVAIGRDGDAELFVALELERIGAGDAYLKSSVALGHREVDRNQIGCLILGRGIDAILVPVELGAELGPLGEEGRRGVGDGDGRRDIEDVVAHPDALLRHLPHVVLADRKHRADPGADGETFEDRERARDSRWPRRAEIAEPADLDIGVGGAPRTGPGQTGERSEERRVGK